MKSLKLHFESLLDDDDMFYDPENDKKTVENWIESNCNIKGKLTISDDLVVNCDGEVRIKNKSIESLTNGLFRWGVINKDFICSFCNNLTSLKGAPENVGGSFYCKKCEKLTSLDGAPKEVRGGFSCSHCDKLETLEGAPKEVGWYFYCNGCNNITSLEGAPKKVNGNFECDGCINLKNLKGAPEIVNGLFRCGNCPDLKITDSDRKKYKIFNLTEC